MNAIQDERSKNICTHVCAVPAAHTADQPIQGLTGIVDKGFKTAFHQTTELRAEIRSEFAALNAKVDQILAALTGRPRP
jgi:hypothetical protein